MTALLDVAKHLRGSLVDEREPNNMDDHVQHNQRHAPGPVGAPFAGDRRSAESGVGYSHGEFSVQTDAARLSQRESEVIV
jgi:hypothetical protein